MKRATRGALTLALLILGTALIVPALFHFHPDGVTLLGAIAWGAAYAASPHHDKKEQS